MCYLIALCSLTVEASRGDQLSIFHDCVLETIQNVCAEGGRTLKSKEQMPIQLRLLGWTCASNADYVCQQAVTKYLVDSGDSVEQFHGKWPFIRLFGIQEPASVVFSIMNGYVHYNGLADVKKTVSIKNPMRNYYILFAYIGMNAWLWSTIFHMRDLPSTEKMDYFSAGTYVLFGLFYAPIRVFRLYDLGIYAMLVKAWGSLCFSALAAHIGYLTFVTFDYGYNMLANVVVGALHAIIWLIYTIKYRSARPAWSYWPALTVLALTCAMSLELCDFAPWLYIIDAHSLWHLATVPITWFWYKFLLKDAVWEQNRLKKVAGKRKA